MKCKPVLVETIADGRKYYGCQRPGCVNRLGPTPHDIDLVRPGSCSAWPEWHEVGEWVEIVLSAAGITKRRWTWVSKRLGLVEISCKCPARKAWLNTFGGRLATSTHWLARWLTPLVVRRNDSDLSQG